MNIRQDPFERTSNLRGQSWNEGSGAYTNDFFAREFWRFVMVQQYVACSLIGSSCETSRPRA